MPLRPNVRLLLAGLLAGSALLAPVPWPTVLTGVINQAPTSDPRPAVHPRLSVGLETWQD